MYRHHYSRGVRECAPSESFDILYRSSCILEHSKAYFEGFFFIYFAAFAKTKNISFLNVNSPHKYNIKIKDN